MMLMMLMDISIDSIQSRRYLAVDMIALIGLAELHTAQHKLVEFVISKRTVVDKLWHVLICGGGHLLQQIGIRGTILEAVVHLIGYVAERDGLCATLLLRIVHDKVLK